MKWKLACVVQVIFFLGVAVGCPVRNGQNGRLIKTEENKEGHWLTPEQILKLEENNVDFTDITDAEVTPRMSRALLNSRLEDSIPTTMRFQDTIHAALPKIQPARMKAFMDPFTTLFNRYYKSMTGLDAAVLLYNEIDKSITDSTYSSTKPVIKLWDHSKLDPEWIQPSIIVRFQGEDSVLGNEVVVIGAHFDSINTDGSLLRAPGANDNASGTTLLLEALRVLLEIDFHPKRSLEFQWYAGEEVGLLGSKDIARTYFLNQTKVVSMFNFDMASYYEGVKKIAVLTDTDLTNPKVAQFLKGAIAEYSLYEPMDTTCGYRCTDHVSFSDYGFPATSSVEPVINTVLHTEGDNMNIVNFELLTEMTKLGIAAVMEMSEVSSMGEEKDSAATSLNFGLALPFTLISTLVIYFR